MSTLKVTDIQSNGTGFNDVVSFQNASGTENGTLCRAFVNFNGTGTVAIRASFNVSSITDSGVGTYGVNFENAMPDANYTTLAQVKASGVVASLYIEVIGGESSGDPTASQTYLRVLNSGANVFDSPNVYAAIFR